VQPACRGFGDVGFENLTFVIYGPPKIMLDAIDLHEDLIEMRLPLSMLSHVGGALRSDLSGKDGTKAIDSESHTLMADIDPAFMQQVFDIA